jgi:hypothetical protein
MHRKAGVRLSAPLAACLLAPFAQAAAQAPPYDGARPGNDIGTGMSLPRSDRASNLDAATTHSQLAPNLPAPPAGEDIQSLLLNARAALAAGRTGEAQESLERAESRALDRSIPQGTERQPSGDPLTSAIAQARSALGTGNAPATTAAIEQALPYAAAADFPK